MFRAGPVRIVLEVRGAQQGRIGFDVKFNPVLEFYRTGQERSSRQDHPAAAGLADLVYGFLQRGGHFRLSVRLGTERLQVNVPGF